MQEQISRQEKPENSGPYSQVGIDIAGKWQFTVDEARQRKGCAFNLISKEFDFKGV
jgi:hypothetical protein